MKVRPLVLAAVTAAVLVPTGRVAADDNRGPDGGAGGRVECPGVFTGTARDLVVPPDGFCIVDGAAISHDLMVGPNAVVAVERTRIGHDVVADRAGNVELGFGGGAPGPVWVGHDVRILGSDAGGSNNVAYDVCDTTVGHDLIVARTAPQSEIEIGDKGLQREEFCVLAVSAPNHVGHDLWVVDNNPGRIDVGDNTVGHDLVVSRNQATDPGPGSIDVSDNQVRRSAVCEDNTPPPSKDGPEDGPNSARRDEGCD